MALPSDVAGDPLADLEPYRGELTGYCYRMLGSVFEADDAVQEALLRAWRARDRFEGRSSLRSWLYRIATNVCLDQLRGRQRRARPVDLSAPGTTASFTGETSPEHTWLEPVPDHPAAGVGDPAERAATSEGIRLAFVAALQHLPPRQRAVLILREVLRWQASEVAELLDTSVASVNSALQRARATLAARGVEPRSGGTVAPEHEELLARYVSAFERYDIAALVALLREDVVQQMPPYPHWLQGADEVSRWMLGPGSGCRGSRLVATAANGCPAFAQYRPDGEGGHRPWAIQVLEVSEGRVASLDVFLDTSLFARFGLPPRL